MPGPIASLNEGTLKSDLRELVRKTVEDTLNDPLEEEAGDLVSVERYERSVERQACRVDHYDRSLTTCSSEVAIRMVKLKGAVHDREHRALLSPRGQRRGGHDQDALRRGLYQVHGGRPREPLGLQRLGGERLQPQRDSL